MQNALDIMTTKKAFVQPGMMTERMVSVMPSPLTTAYVGMRPPWNMDVNMTKSVKNGFNLVLRLMTYPPVTLTTMPIETEQMT